jgi:hypothetical protein
MIALVLTISGCGSVEPVELPKTLAFDQNDPEITFRWLIKQAVPVRDASVKSSKEQSENPLRKERYDAHLESKKKWEEFLNTLIGKRVTWPVYVEKITEKSVEVNCTRREMTEENIKVCVYFRPFGGGGGRFGEDGTLIIGKGITLEEAKTLLPGSTFRLEGVIENFENSVASATGSSYEYIVIRVGKIKAIFPGKPVQ